MARGKVQLASTLDMESLLPTVVGFGGNAAPQYALSTFAFGADHPGGTQTANAAYANTNVNTAGGRTYCVTSHIHPTSGLLCQTVCYYRYNNRLMTARRTWSGSAWSAWTYGVGRSGSPTDPHYTMAIAIDGNGILWFAGVLHNDPLLRTWRGADPDDITIDEYQTAIAAGTPWEGGATYPMFVTRPNGDLDFSFRHGASGSGGQVLLRYDHELDEWRTTHGTTQPWINQWSGGIVYPNSAYMSNLVLDADGDLHAAWHIRTTGQIDTAHDIYYARNPAGTDDWYTRAGDLLSLPIQTTGASPAARVWIVPEAQGLGVRPPRLAVRSDGRPVIVTQWGDPFVQTRILSDSSEDGSGWFVEQVSDDTGEVDWIGTNPEIDVDRFKRSQPYPIVRGDNTWVIDRMTSRGNAITVSKCTTLALDSWTPHDVYPIDSGEMDCVCIDEERRKLNGDTGRIHMYHQFLAGAGGLGSGAAASRTASILEFDLP